MEPKELAARAGLSVETIKRLERQDGPLGVRLQTAAAIKTALEDAGAIFLPENGEGAGVRLRKGASR